MIAEIGCPCLERCGVVPHALSVEFQESAVCSAGYFYWDRPIAAEYCGRSNHIGDRRISLGDFWNLIRESALQQ